MTHTDRYYTDGNRRECDYQSFALTNAPVPCVGPVYHFVAFLTCCSHNRDQRDRLELGPSQCLGVDQKVE